MMQIVNAACGALVGGLLWPFQAWPLAGLAVVSLLAAAFVLAIFAAVSNQRALAVSKRRMQAGLFELRLYQDDPAIVLRAVGALCREQVSYLRHAFTPMIVLALPFTLLIAHLQVHYGHAGLRPGDTALVTVRLQPDAAARLAASPATPGASTAPGASDVSGACAHLTLTAPDGVRVDSPCVWTPSLQEAAWRVRAERDGRYELRIAWDGAPPLTKRLQVSALVVPRASQRPPTTLWAQLLHPGEAPVPAGGAIESIAVSYPDAAIDVAGLSLHWIILFLLLSALFAFLARPAFGVVF